MHFIRVVARCVNRTFTHQWHTSSAMNHFVSRTYRRSLYHVCSHEATCALELCWVLTGPRCIYTFMGRYACHIRRSFPGGVLLTTTDHALLTQGLPRAGAPECKQQLKHPLGARLRATIEHATHRTRELAQSRAPAAFFPNLEI